MKILFIVLAMAIMVTGCGQSKKDSETSVVGQAADKDYLAEGMEHLKNKDLERAIRSFDMAIKQDPTESRNFLFLGQVYLRLQNQDKAADTFDAATKVDPNNAQAFFYLAVSRSLQQRKEEALYAAQRSADLFMQQRDEEMFKQALALVRGLTEQTENVNAQGAELLSPDVSVDLPSIEEGLKEMQE